ncbi:MAG: multidrug effflux MFS transporter [Methylobacteriaceae bacterium]|nr:multidrug effflux MFS transporter [Methylobacteriaceae bacterium]
MRLIPGTLAATLTLGTMTAMVPLATDIYLPAMPAMTRDLATTDARTQLTLSIFMVGFAFGQIFYGPISDRVGRRPAILFGFALFALGSIVCTLATSIETLLAARVAQALGGAGPVVLARAIVRDLYEGPQAGRELSRMAAIMGLTPAVAPVIGAALLTVFGWRSNFAVVALVAVGFGAFVFFVLPETIRARRAEPVSLRAIFAAFADLLRHPPFRIYALLNALAFSGLFAFISVGSFILQGVYGVTELGFALAFGACCIAFVAGSFLSSRIVQRRGLAGSLIVGASLLATGGLTQLAGVLGAPREPLALIGPMMIYMVGIGFTLPASMASALTPFPDRAGAASSFIGFGQTLSGAAVGALLGHALSGSAAPLPIVTSLVGCAAFTLVMATRRLRARG